MYKLFWNCMILVILTNLSTSVGAFGKTTIDPNTVTKEVKEEESFWEADERLAQKVNYEAERKTVLEILDDLSEMTGVSLYAGYNSKDWQVRDRFMVILAQDLPLSELMQSMARVMKFKWSRCESEPYKYRLFMDRKTLLGEEGKAYRAEQQISEEKKRVRAALVNRISELAHMTQEDAAALRETDPYSYALVRSGFAGPMDTLLKEYPELKTALLDGKDFNGYNLAELSPEGQKAAFDFIAAYYRIPAFGGNESGEVPDASKVRIEFEAPKSDNLNSPVIGNLCISSDGFCSAVFLVDPSSAYGKAYGKRLAYAVDTGASKQSLGTYTETVFSGFKVKDVVKDFGEVKVEHEEDHEFQVEIILPPGDNESAEDETRKYETHYDLMLALAKASGMSLVADRPGRFNRQPFSLPAKVELEETLNSAIFVNHNWWRNGKVLEFRDRFWFKKRSLQIPESYMQRWREEFLQTRTFKLDTLAEMAALAGDRAVYAFNIGDDNTLHCDDMEFLMCVQAKQLQPHICLSQNQRALALSDQGLSLDSLSAEQKEIFFKCLSTDYIGGVFKVESNKSSEGGADVYNAFIQEQSNSRHLRLFHIRVPVRNDLKLRTDKD